MQFRAGPLLLEQRIKRGPSILRPRRNRSRSLFLPRHPNLIKLTIIALIFFPHALLHRLHALKPAARIEIHALLAGMQVEPTLGTAPFHSKSLQHIAALRAARNFPRPRQIHRLRPQRMVPLRRTARAFHRRFSRLVASRFTPRLSSRLPIPILISMLPIFRQEPSPARGQYSPPEPVPAQVPGKELSS